MEIKVHKPDATHNMYDQNLPQKPLRMTLKEYLQSTNLKRRINSRSKTKHNKHSDHNLNSLQQPLSHETIEYFKLNQQWKAKKAFNTWIVTLKQLVRSYIPKDIEYLEVIRLIQKIAEFVRTQIQAIKKDNLILQSFLVTEASYWPAEVSAYNQQTNHDKLSNYLKVIINKSSPSHSPNKSQQSIELHSPELKNQLKNPFKTSTQPKIRLHHNQISTNHVSNHQITQGSSTVYKKSHERNLSASQTFEKNLDPDLSKQHYIYSFKDKHLDPKILNSKSSKHPYHQNVHIRPFSEQKTADRIEQEDENLQISKYQEVGLLKINSRNQDQVPRLSLMSRYDENKNQQKSFKNPSQISKTLINNNDSSRVSPNHLSQISTKSQISHSEQTQTIKQAQSRVPLRERRQKAQKIVRQSADAFQMIVLDPRLSLNQKKILQQQASIKRNIKEKEYEKTQQKVDNSKEKSMRNKREQKYEKTPLAFRESPQIVLETPQTLRGRKQAGREITENKKEQQLGVNIKNCSNQKNQGNQRWVRSSSGYYKSAVISDEFTRSNSRQNIMKRYEHFGR